MKGRKLIFKIYFFCTILSIGVSGCITQKNPSFLLVKSRNEFLIKEQQIMKQDFEAYNNAYNKNKIGQLIDSITMSISDQYGMDTLFIIERCNPQLYYYISYIWNGNSCYTIYNSGEIENGTRKDERLLKLIESWDEQQMASISHAKPLAYEGSFQRRIMCSRLIMNKGVCINVETICLSDINFDCSDNPKIFE